MFPMWGLTSGRRGDVGTLRAMTTGHHGEDFDALGVDPGAAVSGPCGQGEHDACRGFFRVRRTDGPLSWVDEEPCRCGCHDEAADLDTEETSPPSPERDDRDISLFSP